MTSMPLGPTCFLFSIFSFTMLMPVLQVIFVGVESLPSESSGLVARATNMVNQIVQEQGRSNALLISVSIVIVATIFKNAFVYASLRILNPLRNRVIRDVRENMFQKSLDLPISDFNEERKGE